MSVPDLMFSSCLSYYGNFKPHNQGKIEAAEGLRGKFKLCGDSAACDQLA